MERFKQGEYDGIYHRMATGCSCKYFTSNLAGITCLGRIIMIHNDETCLNDHHTHICWSAIFAGAFVGVGLGFLLHLFSVAIGLSAYSSSSTAGAQTVLIGGVLGLLIGVIASMGAAGYVAGYLSRLQQCYCHGGIIYGFVTWSMAMILSAILLIPFSHYIAVYNDSLANKAVATASMHEPGPPKAQQSNPIGAAETKATPAQLAWSGWIIFVLFFIGAFASCIGACCGMMCQRKSGAAA